MISSFLRSTRNLSSVHSGSGSGCGPLRSSSDPGRGESALHSLLDPWSDCGKYPDKESHWAAMTLRYSFSRGQIIHGAARRSQQTLGTTPREKFHVSSTEKSATPPRNTSEPPPFGSKLCKNLCKISAFGAFCFTFTGCGTAAKYPVHVSQNSFRNPAYIPDKPLWTERRRLWISSFTHRATVSGEIGHQLTGLGRKRFTAWEMGERKQFRKDKPNKGAAGQRYDKMSPSSNNMKPFCSPPLNNYSLSRRAISE